MATPRRLLVDKNVSGIYHCISRCVRRAYLCGGEYEHRRAWIEQRLAELFDVFAIRPAAYVILSNHMHLVLKTEPAVARSWDDLEVAQRWESLYPKNLEKLRKKAGGGEAGEETVEQHLRNLAANTPRIEELRSRLSDLSWLHRLLKEPIARRANAEDGCTGHFWEGRFKSYKLLDEGGVLAATVYVDLNLFRAGMIKTLEKSEFSSLILRLLYREARRQRRRAKRGARRGQKLRARSAREMLSKQLMSTRDLFGISNDEYVSLVARTAGVPVDSMDHGHKLRALDIDEARWPKVLMSTSRLFGSVVGGAMSRLKEADRRSTRHVVNALDVFDSG